MKKPKEYLQEFLDILRKSGKIKTADDLIPEIIYEWFRLGDKPKDRMDIMLVEWSNDLVSPEVRAYIHIIINDSKWPGEQRYLYVNKCGDLLNGKWELDK